MSVDADRRIAQPISHAFVTLLLQAGDRTVAKFALSFLARPGTVIWLKYEIAMLSFMRFDHAVAQPSRPRAV